MTGNILVVEDQPLAAVDLCGEIECRGWKPVLATTVFEAEERLKFGVYHAAIVSNRIAGEKTKSTRRVLLTKGIPILMHSTNVRHLFDKPYPVVLKRTTPRAVVDRLVRAYRLEPVFERFEVACP